MLKKSKKWLIILLSGFITCVIMAVLLYMNGFAPFGDKSLAGQDANIQYLDFYSYLKDVADGKNSILYSFGKTLGGTNIAVFSYYLSSPFMLLSLLFKKAQMNAFFNINVTLKLTTASMTFCYFLLKRFEKKIDDKCRLFFVIALSVAYSLSQYSIAQSSNIMWLDGVYMLPLILLGVYRIVQGKKNSGLKLAVAVGYSIFVNWYIAGINCVFSGIWFLFEYALSCLENKQKNLAIKNFIITSVRYILYMLLGVMLSACVFLPTIKALGNSSRGELNLSKFFTEYFSGNIFSTLQNYSYGAISNKGSVALFCGCLTLIGAVCFFVNRYERIEKKIILGIMAFLGLMCYYFEPLTMVFSLFKVVSSYWYRYSHIGIFILLFISASYYIAYDKSRNIYLPCKSGVAIALLLLALDYVHPVNDSDQTYLTVVMFSIMGLCISLLLKNSAADCNKRNIKMCFISVALICLCVIDYSYNASLLMDICSVSDVDEYYEYVTDQQKQIDQTKSYDDSIYRMTQTSTRNMYDNGLTANYNEALAFGYWSISGYTSSPDDNQRNFLQRLGYRKNGENMCIVDTSILGADSLLGVKYVMSSYDINGLVKVSDIDTYNGKAVYENPYSLPMAFVYSGSTENATSDKEDPFEYQNSLYRELTGNDSDVYEELEYTVDASDAGNVYNISVPEGNYAVYGDIPWFGWPEVTLDVNGSYTTPYACWLSESVFYIPTGLDDTSANVTLNTDKLYSIDSENVSFYALNLDTLAMMSEKLRNGIPDEYDISNGHIKVNVTGASSDQKLFLSVPYDKGWTVTRNGKKIEVTDDMLVGDCLYSISLVDGDNDIELIYHVQGLNTGIIISLISILIIIVLIVMGRRKNK